MNESHRPAIQVFKHRRGTGRAMAACVAALSLTTFVTAGKDIAPMCCASPKAAPLPPRTPLAGVGRKLFLKNCAQCHGPDARGEDGPDLHDLDWTDQQIAARIRNGAKGQMPAFAPEFSRTDLKKLVAYVQSLKSRGLRCD